jgi:hypothetical protein
VPRVRVVGFLLCLAVGLILASSAPAASPKLIKHCSGTVSASQSGVRLAGGDIRIGASAYDATKVQTRAIWPALGCGKARSVLHAYLTAKLTRPVNKCTAPALRGTGCKVGQWVCYSPNPLPPKLPRGSYEQVCLHVLADPHGPVRRLTSIFFRETDHDHA